VAAIVLNDVRQVIEERVNAELKKAPVIPVVFNNVPYTATKNSWVQCLINFGSNSYLTLGGTTGSANLIDGIVVLNVFTEIGLGAGENLEIATRLRNLFNRVIVSGVYFDAANGPDIQETSSPQNYFQSQIRITFETVEEL
tara:strand:- start:546 stop:968 length:423 start_codon:yes stop_codon:yes gene_type:complete